MEISHLLNKVYQHFDQVYDNDELEQQAYLKQLKNSEPEVAEQLNRMLESAADLNTFYHEIKVTENPSNELKQGSRVGRWEIIKPLGSGGMGNVYLVKRCDGAHQGKAALKLLRYRDQTHLRALRNETQVLAHFEHNAISRLIDAGESKYSFFMVTEYIDGLPLDGYVEANIRHETTLVQLLLKLAKGLEYVHRQFRVHGDVKPANILVNAEGQPKLIDFALSQKASSEREILAYSPGYSSPEHISGSRLHAGSDIYSFGAIIYNLLSDKLLPKDAAFNPKNDLFVEQLKTLPFTPSKKLISILKRCLSTEPSARYPSMSQLCDDLDAILEKRTLQADNHKLSARAFSFIQRNPFLTLVASLFVFASFMAGYQGHNAKLERDLALREEQRLRNVQHYLYQIFSESSDLEVPAKQALNKVTKQILERESNQQTSSAVLLSLAELYFRIDDYASSLPLYLEYLKISEQDNNEQSRRAMAQHDLASIYLRLGKLDESREYFSRAMKFWNQSSKQFSEEILEAQDLKARLERESGNIKESLTIFENAIQQRLTQSSKPNMDLGFLYNNYGTTLFRIGELTQAQEAFKNAMQVWKSIGRTQSNDALNSLNNLASIAAIQKQYPDAIKKFREALAIREALYGESAATAALISNLAKMLLEVGKLEEATSLLQRAITMANKFAGKSSPLSFAANFGLVKALTLNGKLEKATQLASSLLASAKKTFGDKATYTGLAIIEVARTQIANQQVSNARASLNEARKIFEPMGARMTRQLELIDSLAKQINSLNSSERQTYPSS